MRTGLLVWLYGFRKTSETDLQVRFLLLVSEPMKCKLYIMAILLAAAQPAAAAADTVQVNTGCCEGNAFTIKVPVRIPAGASGVYEWFRNDTATGVRDALAAGATVLTYTLPAEKAYGYGKPVTLHFEYHLKDDCDDCNEWTESKRYALTFAPRPAQPAGIAGSMTVCAGSAGLTYAVESAAAGVSYTWTVPSGWAITAGQGSSSVTVTPEASAGGGNISVTPGNACGYGATRTQAVMMNAASAIEGSTVVCIGDASLTYAVESLAGVTYAWTVPAGWAIMAGQGSSSITVMAGTADGTVSVAPSDGGCTGKLGVSINDECICLAVVPGSVSVAACEGVSAVGSVSIDYCSGVSAVGDIGIAYCNGVSVVGTISIAEEN